MMNIKTFK